MDKVTVLSVALDILKKKNHWIIALNVMMGGMPHQRVH